MIIRTLNDAVMTEPFEARFQTGTTASGLAVSKTHTAMVGLKVLADGPEGIRAGDTIYVAGTCSVQPWATKSIFEFEGQKCIFVPKSFVNLVRRREPGKLPPPVASADYHSYRSSN